MIKKLKLKNFRGIKEGELNLAPLTILLGPNNAGKSTILEALFLVPNPLRGVPYKQEYAIKVVNSIHQTLNSTGYVFLLFNYIAEKAEVSCLDNDDVWKSVYFTKNRDSIIITTNVKSLKASISINEINVPYFGTVSLSMNNINKAGDMITLITDNSLLLKSSLIGDGYYYLYKHWAEIVNSGICKTVANEASDMSPEKYDDITLEPFLGGTLTLYAYLKDGRRIRLGDIGDGIQNYIIARTLYEVEKPELLLWDDVEAHLNPRVITALAEWFFDIINEGKQAVVTTHSLEAAQIIASVNEENTIIYLISMDKNILKSKKLTLKKVEKLKKAGIDIRAAEPLLL